MPKRSQTGASVRRLPTSTWADPSGKPIRLSHAFACSGVSCSGSTVMACASTPSPAARIASRISTAIRGHAERHCVKMKVSTRTLPRALVGVRTTPLLVAQPVGRRGGPRRRERGRLSGRRLGHQRRSDAAQRTKNQADEDRDDGASEGSLHAVTHSFLVRRYRFAVVQESGLSLLGANRPFGGG